MQREIRRLGLVSRWGPGRNAVARLGPYRAVSVDTSVWAVPEFRDFFFEICGMVSKCRNSREICPSACEICLASAIFMPHIHSPFAFGLLPVRREIPDTGQTPDHPPPIALSTAALPWMRCFISPNPKYELRRAQSVWRPCALLLRRAHGLGICVCCVA